MTENPEQEIRRLMDALLLETGDGRHGTLPFFKKVVEGCTEKEVDYREDVAFGHWWYLVRIGAVVPVGKTEGIPCLPQFTAFLVTKRGRVLLEKGQVSPHDPVRYFEAVRQRVHEPDEIALTYLDEAVGAWSCALYRSSAVMLGCAFERLVKILADHIVKSGISPWNQKIEKTLQKTPVRISELFESIRQCLNHLNDEKQIPVELGDALDRRLSSIFDRARSLRNKSGHPTGAKVSHDEALAGLLLFPDFCAFVDGLCQELDSKSRPAKPPAETSC